MNPFCHLQIRPDEVESDQERLLLFQEKKQLLLEYRSITPKSRSKQEMTRIQQICKKLESDLNNAYEESNQCIATRLKLHEDKQMLLQQLLDALKEVTHLENQLKSVSASTLSISSGSSLGSLSTASSKGSLSGLSFTDIYGDPLSTEAHLDLIETNRRVQRLFHPSSEVSLSPRSSLSVETPPASPLRMDVINEPMYENTAQPHYDYNNVLDRRRLEEHLQDLKLKQTLGLASPLSPIYEKPSLLYIPQAALISRSSSASNTRSVSAAVSDESVAGDSGVFEASHALLQNKESAQVQIGIKYVTTDSVLQITIEKARNLSVLSLPDGCSQLYIKLFILPGSAQQTLRTNLFTDFIKPVFNNYISVQIPLNKIYTKSLQVKVIGVIGQKEDWLVILNTIIIFNTLGALIFIYFLF